MPAPQFIRLHNEKLISITEFDDPRDRSIVRISVLNNGIWINIGDLNTDPEVE